VDGLVGNFGSHLVCNGVGLFRGLVEDIFSSSGGKSVSLTFSGVGSFSEGMNDMMNIEFFEFTAKTNQKQLYN
jgi:hypothetical protein